MRIAETWNTPQYRVFIYTMENHWYVEFEAGPMKQGYKFSKEKFASLADMKAALTVAGDKGFKLRSFVYPRNQSSPAHNAVLKQLGFTSYRGNQRAWAYLATDGTGQSLYRRAFRLADNYLNLSGHHGQKPLAVNDITEIAASRYLRKYSDRFSMLERMRLHRIMNSMSEAAASKQIFHLWWHPHDFGQNLDQNIAVLDDLLQHYKSLQDRFGMVSKNMAELA